MRIVRFSGTALEFGAKEHRVEGVVVKVYDPAKTAAGCFNYRNKIGLSPRAPKTRWRTGCRYSGTPIAALLRTDDPEVSGAIDACPAVPSCREWIRWKWIEVKPYPVPFRCLYSRNVENRMMACKCVSVSHVAGSSTRTMLNSGHFGVATTAAAFLCKKYNTTPRGIYKDHIKELREIVNVQGQYKDALTRR